MTASAYSFTTINTTSLPDSMTNAQVYSTFKSCVLRLHDALNMRRNKKTKPQLVIVSFKNCAGLSGHCREPEILTLFRFSRLLLTLKRKTA